MERDPEMRAVISVAAQFARGTRSTGLAKAASQAVQGRRLRDQVYDLIKDDLKSGNFKPDKRFFEVELAEKYGVSRTPVREALFQLVGDGLLVSEDRGYTLPIDTPKRFADRMEVHLLIDPRVAFYAAGTADREAVKRARKAYDRARRAHLAGKYSIYIDAVHEFRVGVRTMCDNEPLQRCSMFIEDQFVAARNELFKVGSYREMDVDFNGRVLAAIEAGDGPAAEIAMREYMLAVKQLASGSDPRGTPG
jgi:DNA-binding GntR family transcriptional regulator